MPTARKTETAAKAIAGNTLTVTVFDEKKVFATTSNTFSFTSSSFASSINGAENERMASRDLELGKLLPRKDKELSMVFRLLLVEAGWQVVLK